MRRMRCCQFRTFECGLLPYQTFSALANAACVWHFRGRIRLVRQKFSLQHKVMALGKRGSTTFPEGSEATKRMRKTPMPSYHPSEQSQNREETTLKAKAILSFLDDIARPLARVLAARDHQVEELQERLVDIGSFKENSEVTYGIFHTPVEVLEDATEWRNIALTLTATTMAQFHILSDMTSKQNYADANGAQTTLDEVSEHIQREFAQLQRFSRELNPCMANIQALLRRTPVEVNTPATRAAHYRSIRLQIEEMENDALQEVQAAEKEESARTQRLLLNARRSELNQQRLKNERSARYLEEQRRKFELEEARIRQEELDLADEDGDFEGDGSGEGVFSPGVPGDGMVGNYHQPEDDES
ncbi:hypothetical protein HGRIS_003195 [Hohenbuehelia grisea]|uniref:Uncharacterized protein n=1 Tax=Hohenbuehelia grisea TaxID=104357 RepID=A0ABR3JMZ2_9AGAR